MFESRVACSTGRLGERLHGLTSLTGYKKFNFHYLEDYDGGRTRVNDYRPGQRRRILEPGAAAQLAGDGPVTWFVGASVYEETVDGRV